MGAEGGRGPSYSRDQAPCGGASDERHYRRFAATADGCAARSGHEGEHFSGLTQAGLEGCIGWEKKNGI